MLTKPKVLFVIDLPNWAHDNKTGYLSRYLSDSFHIEKRFYDTLEESDLDNADLVVFYFWMEL